MQGRTDLAAEGIEGMESLCIRRTIRKSGSMEIESIIIADEESAGRLGRRQGKYITATLTDRTEDLRKWASALSEEISEMLPKDGTVLVAGLGNEKITPDALGPRSAGRILATRHISGEKAKAIGLENLRSTAVIAPGVLGQTGVEAAELIVSLCGSLKPSAVIVIDALASRSLSRLGRTVQICDTGIAPGSGVGNDRPEISEQTAGVPVIAIGIPTVTDAVPLNGEQDERRMMVTPRDIDILIERSSKLLAYAVNQALQPDFDPEELSGTV